MSKFSAQPWSALAIVALGFALRLVNLGGFSFWFDEVGQVLVGRADTLASVVEIAAAHYGAAPLDYLITWAGVRLVGESEFGLRFISLTWSVLSVALVYGSGERLQRGVGAWAALLVATSPLAVRYAQEVRFYSLALMFCAATLWLMLHAPRRAWVLALSMALGLYAHAYTALLWPFAGWAAICRAPRAARLRVGLRFLAAAALAAALFGPWLFGELLGERVPPFADAAGLNAETLRRVLAGWEWPNLSPVPARNTAGLPLPYLVIGLHVGATALALAQPRRSALWLGALAVYFAATLLVVLNDMRVGYFFAPRQVLNLLVLRALFGGWVLWRVQRALHLGGRAAGLVLAGAVLLISAPSLAAHYANQRDKSNAARVAETLIAFAPDEFWIAPAYDQLTVNYYLERRGAAAPAWRVFDAVSESAQPQSLIGSTGRVVVVLQASQAAPETLRRLEQAGFVILWPDHHPTGNEHFIALGRPAARR